MKEVFMRRPVLIAIWFAAIVFVVGCGSTPSSTTTNPTPRTPPPTDGGAPGTTASAGGSKNELFNQHCGKCHTTTGAASSGGPGFKGPDLGKFGGDAAHTLEWTSEHIRNPKSHKPESRMPAFADKLKAEEIKKLAEYLLTLK
jgi:mono/diheme cytochrome c family protein